MPARIRYDVLIVDRSPLAKNMYQVLFSGQPRFRISFGEEYRSLFKKSPRLRPDLLLLSSNVLSVGETLHFPCPTIVITSKTRFDIRESVPETPHTLVIEKPFFPYDLLSHANRLVHDRRETPRRGRPPGRRGRERKKK